MNRFIKTKRLTNKTTRTCRKGMTTSNNIINRFTDIIHSLTESRQVIGFLITSLRTDVVRHTGGTEGTVTDD